jgi:hypothetical protein
MNGSELPGPLIHGNECSHEPGNSHKPFLDDSKPNFLENLFKRYVKNDLKQKSFLDLPDSLQFGKLEFKIFPHGLCMIHDSQFAPLSLLTYYSQSSLLCLRRQGHNRFSGFSGTRHPGRTAVILFLVGRRLTIIWILSFCWKRF